MRIFIEKPKRAGMKFIKLKYSIESCATIPKSLVVLETLVIAYLIGLVTQMI